MLTLRNLLLLCFFSGCFETHLNIKHSSVVWPRQDSLNYKAYLNTAVIVYHQDFIHILHTFQRWPFTCLDLGLFVFFWRQNQFDNNVTGTLTDGNGKWLTWSWKEWLWENDFLVSMFYFERIPYIVLVQLLLELDILKSKLKRIQDPIKHLWWSVFTKIVTVESHCYFCKNAPLQMIG